MSTATQETQASPAAQKKDGISLLFADHQRFRSLIKDYTSAAEPSAKHAVIDTLIREVVPHSSAEERVVYPLLKSLPSGKVVLDRHYLDDTVNLQLMEFLQKMDPAADWELYDRKGGGDTTHR